MKKIKVFLASSINGKFKDLRNCIGDCVRIIQDDLIEREIRINLFQCEYADNFLTAMGRKQDEYTMEAITSDIFIIIIGERIGEWTLEEYNAVKNLENIEKNVIFYNCEYNQSVKDFKEQIKDDKLSSIHSFDTEEQIREIIKKIIYGYVKEN